MLTNMIWKHHQNCSNVFVGEPSTSVLCGTVYGFDGGFLWEVKLRCPCCQEVSLIRQGCNRNKKLAMIAAEKYIHKWIRINSDD